MKEPYSTAERNAQIVISLLKANNINKVVVSPGSTNISVVGSLQNDSFFELYSCVDERSAAYMACGMAIASGKPVVLSCTGATASRNYYSALTEAFYRKIPVLVLTSSQDRRLLGHLKDQVTDRGNHPSDLLLVSEYLQTVKDDADEWDVTIKANRAILELWHRGGGPAHIDIQTEYDRHFLTKEIKPVRVIRRYTLHDVLPEIPSGIRVALFIGTHRLFSLEEVDVIDSFCEKYNAVVFGTPDNGYYGKYYVNSQRLYYWDKNSECNTTDLIIHIGEIAWFDTALQSAKQVWRVSEDGELRDRSRKLRAVFEMPEYDFFKSYSEKKERKEMSFFNRCNSIINEPRCDFSDLPLSGIWAAYQIHDKIPPNSYLFLGILSPLRSFSFFDRPANVMINCNQGGFGIDGNMSTMIGASLVYPDQLFFGIVGDLSFFYDLNVLGNRHVGRNVRILLVNNGEGCEFQLDGSLGASLAPDDINAFISAGGHFGKQSPSLVKNFVTGLGFDYLTASTKEEFEESMKSFISPEIGQKPVVFEVFTESSNEKKALNMVIRFDDKEDKRNQTILEKLKDSGKKLLNVVKK